MLLKVNIFMDCFVFLKSPGDGRLQKNSWVLKFQSTVSFFDDCAASSKVSFSPCDYECFHCVEPLGLHFYPSYATVESRSHLLQHQILSGIK
jgi:hypothetical protein